MHDDPTDPLSPLGRKLLKLDADAYGQLCPAGNGNAAARDLLESTQPADLVAGQVASRDDAKAMLAGLWLYFDFLDESHTISQSLENPTGSFWHAIMHRREGDFSNAKYWFRHVGEHPVFREIEDFDPYDFVDQWQAVARGKSDAREECLDTQQAEWEALFDYCYRNAIR